MEPLDLEQQVKRQIEKGCRSGKDVIENYLKISSYYSINYDYEPYIIVAEDNKGFTIKDYKWLEETNEKVSKESLTLILRAERIIRNKLADFYSLYCKQNSFQYFSTNSLIIDTVDFPDATTDEEKNKIKNDFISECWIMYEKKKKLLNSKYHYHRIEDVPPFVISQHLSFGQIRKFFKLLNKDIKEKLVSSFNLKISEFNPLIEKLNYLRNACAHGDYVLSFKTQKLPKISNQQFHVFSYNSYFDLTKNKIGLIPTLSMCAYLLQDNINFFISTIRNILEITNYNNKGSINNNLLLSNLGLLTDTKTVQFTFKV